VPTPPVFGPGLVAFYGCRRREAYAGRYPGASSLAAGLKLPKARGGSFSLIVERKRKLNNYPSG